MTSLEGIKLAIGALNELQVPYMIVGSLSSNFYAVPRSTQDADFVIETDQEIQEIGQRLSPEFTVDPQIGFETMFMTTKYQFLQSSTAFKLEVFVLSQDPYDRERFSRRIRQTFEGLVVYVPTAEDVIVQKVRWGRRKDVEDVRSILQVQGDSNRLDWPYIHGWCEKHGTRALLDEIRRTTPTFP